MLIHVVIQKVNTVYKTEDTGPTAEFEFKRGYNPSIKVGFKKVITKEWNVTISLEHDKVYYSNRVSIMLNM